MKTSLPQVAAVVLAAGRSQRMNARKQLIEIEGQALVRRAVQTALGANFSFVTVALDPAETATSKALGGLEFETAWVQKPELGQSESIRAGLEVAAARGCDAILFMPCDLPLLTSAHLDELIARFQTGDFLIVASRYSEILGTPLILGKALWNEIRELRGDVGARKILAKHSAVTASVDWEGGKFDLDTPEDVQQFLANK